MPEPQQTDERAKNARFVWWFAVGLVVLVVGAIVAHTKGWAYLRDRGARTNRGTASGAALVELASGMHALAIVDDSGEQTPERGHHRPLYRITTIDLATGKRQQMRIFEDALLCWSAARDRVWCRTGHDGTLLLNASTLATVGKAEELAAAALHAKPLTTDDALSVVDGGLVLRLDDGRAARIDATTLAVTEADDKRPMSGVPSRNTCVFATTLGGHHFSAGTRQTVVTGNTSPSPNAPVFLEPQFLVVGSLLLVQHRVKLDTPALQLSKLDGDRVVWTAEVGACETAALDGHMIVLTTHDTSMRAIAIDVDTGVTLWKLAF